MAQAKAAERTVVKAVQNGSASTAGAPSTTTWPKVSQSRAASWTAATQSGCTVEPSSVRVEKAIRSRPGGLPTSSRNARAGGGAQ